MAGLQWLLSKIMYKKMGQIYLIPPINVSNGKKQPNYPINLAARYSGLLPQSFLGGRLSRSLGLRTIMPKDSYCREGQ